MQEDHPKIDATNGVGRRAGRSFRIRRPSSVQGWIIWLLVALLFLFIIARVMLLWWSAPVPTTPPAVPPDESTRQAT